MPDFAWLLAQHGTHEPEGFLGLVDRLARTQLSTIVMFVAACTAARVFLFAYLRSVEPHRRIGPAWMVSKFLNEAFDAIVYAGVFVFLVIRPFALQTFYIPSESMLDTLRVNDYIVANKFVYRISEPKVGDIVVFKPPKRAYNTPAETDFIKRLIGAPGDVVELRNGWLYRNGQKVEEPYLYQRTPAVRDFKLVEHQGRIIPFVHSGGTGNEGPPTRAEFQIPDFDEQRRLADAKPQPVPKGWYLMIGDNRNGSDDGRYWGLVPRRQIIGRSEFIWMPISRIRSTR